MLKANRRLHEQTLREILASLHLPQGQKLRINGELRQQRDLFQPAHQDEAQNQRVLPLKRHHLS